MKFRSLETIIACPLRNGLTKPKKIRGKGYKMVNMGELFSTPMIKNLPMDRVPLSEKEMIALLEDGDLLFARQSLVREGAGQCSIFLGDEEEVCFESHLIRCRIDKEKANPLFLFYYFRCKTGKDNIDLYVEQGAGAAGIRGTDLLKVLVPDISLPIQNLIANILFCLDSKIFNNTQTNQTLESMAQAIFKSWFVDFDPVHHKMRNKAQTAINDVQNANTIAYPLPQEILDLFPDNLVESELGLIPEGWEVKSIKNFGKTITGKTPPKKIENAYNSDGLPFITPSDIDNDIFVTDTKRSLSEEGINSVKNSKINSNTICVTCIGSQMGRAVIAPYDAVSNQQINSIEVSDDFYIYYLFLNLRNRREEIFLIGSSGSTMPIINKTTFEKLRVLLPCKSLLRLFDNKISSLFKKILCNSIENIELANLRDTLLPRLLSGEIDLAEPLRGVTEIEERQAEEQVA